MRRVIACDLGSNTLRIVQLCCESGVREKEFERIVRTAKGLHINKRIGDEAIKNIMDALSEACQIFDFHSIPTECVTTEAMRQAYNAKDFLATIQSTYGLTFKIIQGSEEAALTRLGVEHALLRLGIACENYVLMDLGGGSMELTCKHDEVVISESFPIGIVTIAETYKTLDAIKKGVRKELICLEAFAKKVFTCKALNFIATAGTPTTVAAFLQGMSYEQYEHEKITGTELSCEAYHQALEELLALKEERVRYVGVGRSDLIIAGICIVTAVMEYFKMKTCLVIDDGLREGVAISKCNIGLKRRESLS